MKEHVSDPLDAFHGMASCPVCGCLAPVGALRCPECGTFHSGHVMEERTAPTPEEREASIQRSIDPSMYSLGPSSSVPDESFEESTALTTWEGGSTDFSFEDDDEPIQTKPSVDVPPAELIAKDEGSSIDN